MSEPQHPQSRSENISSGHSEPVAGDRAPLESASFRSFADAAGQLARLREAKGWSVGDVSARLKVVPAKISALEAGDVSQLPGTAFAVGIVRGYAKMLGIDPKPFTQALRHEKGEPEPVDLSMTVARSSKDLSHVRVAVPFDGSKSRSWGWGIAAAVIAVIAVSMWQAGRDTPAWFARLKPSANAPATAPDQTSESASTVVFGSSASAQLIASAPEVSSTVQPNASASATADAAISVSSTSAESVDQAQAQGLVGGGATVDASSEAATVAGKASASASTPPSSDAAVASAPSSSTTLGEDELVVTMKATHGSWVSVRTQDGHLIFSGLIHASEKKVMRGEPPFKVTIGNMTGIESLTLNGQPVDAAKYASTKGNVARFSLP